MGKRTAQKDTIIDFTSDSQVNSNFPNGWSSASLTFNNYFYLFLYLYITWITISNNAPHLKSPKNQNRRAALGHKPMFVDLLCTWLAIYSVFAWTSERALGRWGWWALGPGASMLGQADWDPPGARITLVGKALKSKQDRQKFFLRCPILGYNNCITTSSCNWINKPVDDSFIS